MTEANGCGVDREPDDRYFAAVSVSGAATQVRVWPLVVVVPAASLIHLAGFFLSYLFLSWLCASVMSRLCLDIILLQRLDVIDIFLILINFLYRKMVCTIKNQ
jgi:hypothetical protein